MLNLDHPQSNWIIAASHENDAILNFAKLMTLLPTPQRQELLPRVARHIKRLRRYNREHFNASVFIDGAIVELETGCTVIANLKSSESRLSGQGTCPVCSSPITDLPDYSDMTYCETCLGNFHHARQLLGSPNGFGFCAI
jgi:hypothetical protein